MIDIVAGDLIQKLNHSIDLLVKAIDQAGETLGKKPHVPLNTIKRLQHYKEITTKQRKIVDDIISILENKQFDQLWMEIQRVNALSNFIREDAVDLINDISPNPVRLYRPDGH